jgi:hypothetical protein
MVKQNINNSNFLSVKNPLIIIIILFFILIIVLSIFRDASPFLNLGLGVNANVGGLKGSFNIEAFSNNSEEEEKSSLYVQSKNYYVLFPPNFDKNLPISKLFFPSNLNNIGGIKFSVVRQNNGFPYLVYSDSSTEEDKNTPLNYVPQSGVRSNIYLPKEFKEDQEMIKTSFLIQSNKKNSQGNFNMIKVCDVTLYTGL